MSGPQANGRLLGSSPPPAVWATTLLQIYVIEGSAGFHWNTRPVSYMNMFNGTDDWHKWCIHWADNHAHTHGCASHCRNNTPPLYFL